MHTNPLLQESIKLGFQEDGAVKRYLIFIGVTGILTLLAWPREHFLFYVAPRRAPAAYTITTIASFLLAAFFTSEFAVEFISRDEYHKLSEWFRLTPVSLMQVFFGKAGFALLHTVYIFLIPMPFIVMAAAVCGVTIYRLAAGALVSLSVLLAYRFLGLLMITVTESARVGINFLLKATIALSLLLTPKYLPAANPIVVLLRLQTEGQSPAFLASPPEYLKTSLAYLAVAVVFGSGVLIGILVRGRKYRNDQ